MKGNNYFVGVRFNKDKTLFNKLNKDPLSNSEIIRKALRQYFISKDKNQTEFNAGGSYNQDMVHMLNNQIEFLQGEVSFLRKHNVFLSLPWYKKAIYQLEEKNK